MLFVTAFAAAAAVVVGLAKQEGLVSIRINHKIIDDEVITNNKNDFRHLHIYTYTSIHYNTLSFHKRAKHFISKKQEITRPLSLMREFKSHKSNKKSKRKFYFNILYRNFLKTHRYSRIHKKININIRRAQQFKKRKEKTAVRSIVFVFIVVNTDFTVN